MPHLILAGVIPVDAAAAGLRREPYRWGRAVLKSQERWRRHGGEELLVEGVVVEFARPQHPVALVAPHDDGWIVRLWPPVTVERTPAVQRWLCLLALELQGLGAGPLVRTSIPEEVWSDLALERA